MFCYTCMALRSLCPPGQEEDSCAVNEGISAEMGEHKAMPFIYMKGGTTRLASQMDFTRDFDAGMHAYREARRNGEQPDTTSVEGVEKARRRQERMAYGLEGFNG